MVSYTQDEIAVLAVFVDRQPIFDRKQKKVVGYEPLFRRGSENVNTGVYIEAAKAFQDAA